MSAAGEAFAQTRRDPELLDEAKKKRLEVDPMPGEDLEELAKEVLPVDEDVIERMEKLLGNEVPISQKPALRKSLQTALLPRRILLQLYCSRTLEAPVRLVWKVTALVLSKRS